MHRVKHLVRSSTSRVTLGYLSIIMAMSISFSTVFYHASARELNRPAPSGASFRMNSPQGVQGRLVDDFLEQRAAEGQRNLLTSLVVLNVLTLAAGSFISYTLARKTLEPIEQAMEAQTRFASDASHELRTPLAAIQAENEVALRKSNLTLARAKELLQSNLEEANKLRLLAEGLLQLTRTEHTTVHRAAIALSDISTNAINRIIPAAQAKDITVTDVVENFQVRGDEGLLTQAVVILLDNAVKYSPEHTTIHISAVTEGKWAIIQVRDEGPGIADADQAHVFERFYRADASRSSQHTTGYGLGLSIAHKIIELHDGHISVASTPGHGATFTLKLPL